MIRELEEKEDSKRYRVLFTPADDMLLRAMEEATVVLVRDRIDFPTDNTDTYGDILAAEEGRNQTQYRTNERSESTAQRRCRKGQHNTDLCRFIFNRINMTRLSCIDLMLALLIILFLAFVWSGSTDRVLGTIQVTCSRWLDQGLAYDLEAGRYHRDGVSPIGMFLDVKLNFIGVWLCV